MEMPDVLRLALIIQMYYPHIGGAETVVGETAPLLRASGADVHVLTRRYPGTLPLEDVDGVRVHRFSAPGGTNVFHKAVASIVFTLRALPLLRKLRPQVIHAHELLSPATTAVAAKALFGGAVIATVHGGGHGPHSELTRLMNKPAGRQRLRLYRRMVDCFLSISHDIDQQLDELGIPASRRVLLSNGVNSAHFVPTDPTQKEIRRRELGLPPAAPLALFVGRLAPEKRLDRLMQLWPGVRQAHLQACLVILGEGPEEQKLKELAGDGILFPGSTHDVIPWLQAADLFILPSEAEGISMALLEAMSCALPVLATDVGGNPELVTHGETGWLVPPDDEPAMRRAVQTLLGDSDLREQLGKNARRYVEANYALTNSAARLLALYHKIAETAPRRRP
jgi:glycosyltransferase involved in cell wall biosynthesis